MSAPSRDGAFSLFPVPVSPEFRKAVLEQYPALNGDTEKAVAYRRMLQYALFAGFPDSETGDIVLPYRAVAELARVPPTRRGFAAGEWIDNFSRDVTPLNPGDYRYKSGKARTIRPEFTAINRAVAEEARRTAATEPRVFFETGERVSRRSERKAIAEQEEHFRALSAASVDGSHPAYTLLHFLLAQPQDRISRLIEANFPLVQEAIASLPEATDRQRERKRICHGILIALRNWRSLYYTASAHTPRLFAIGVTIHQLPREIRRIALKGCIEFDLKSAQLAVVARIWDIPILQEFLLSGRSIWREMADCAEIESDIRKPIFKRTIYSAVFGMTRDHLLEQLANGTVFEEGVGKEKAFKILRHPLLRALLTARNRAMKAIWRDGGACDAWGSWITLEAANGVRDERSVLSHVAQSYELQLMLPVVDAVRTEKQIYLASWLHDGTSLLFGDKTKMARQIRKIEQAVRDRAHSCGIVTGLEIEEL